MVEGRRGRKLGRTSSHRKALLENLARELFQHGQISTTLQKAKELRSFAERLITKAKRGGLANRRLILKRVKDRESADKIFSDYLPRFKDRPGGYTRIIKLGFRQGDRARLAIIKLIDEPYSREEKNV